MFYFHRILFTFCHCLSTQIFLNIHVINRVVQYMYLNSFAQCCHHHAILTCLHKTCDARMVCTSPSSSRCTIHCEGFNAVKLIAAFPSTYKYASLTTPWNAWLSYSAVANQHRFTLQHIHLKLPQFACRIIWQCCCGEYTLPHPLIFPLMTKSSPPQGRINAHEYGSNV